MINVISYETESIAPHQGMFSTYIEQNHADMIHLQRRIIPNDRYAKLLTLLCVIWDTLFHRGSFLYFSSFVSAPFAFLPAILNHKYWIYHSQDWIQDNHNLSSWLERIVVRRATWVIWNEQNRARRAKELSGRKSNIYVLPTFLPRSHTVPEPRPHWRKQLMTKAKIREPNTIIIFAGGGYSKARLSETIVKAMDKVDQNSLLVFSGRERLPADLKSDRVVDVGMLPYKDMLELMASSDIGVLLYDHRGSFGNRYQQPGRFTEYLRCGLHLIATPFPCAQALAGQTTYCQVVHGYSSDEISEALNALIRVRRNSHESRSDIKRFAHENTSYETFAAKIASQILVPNQK